MNRISRMSTACALISLIIFVLEGALAQTLSSNDQMAQFDLEELEFTTTSTMDLNDAQNVVIPKCNETVRAEWMTDWTPPERLRQWFPTYRLGTDDDGVATYLNLFGRYNFKKFLDEATEEERAAVDKYFDYIDNKIACDGTAHGGDGIISILDWDGFSISNYNRGGVIHLAIKQLAKLGKLSNSVKKTFSINTNFPAEVLLNTIRPQLGKFLENFQIYGTQKEKWIPQLLHSIPKHILPVKYGGTNNNIDL